MNMKLNGVVVSFIFLVFFISKVKGQKVIPIYPNGNSIYSTDLSYSSNKSYELYFSEDWKFIDSRKTNFSFRRVVKKIYEEKYSGYILSITDFWKNGNPQSETLMKFNDKYELNCGAFPPDCGLRFGQSEFYFKSGELEAEYSWINGETYSKLVYNKKGDIVDGFGEIYEMMTKENPVNDMVTLSPTGKPIYADNLSFDNESYTLYFDSNWELIYGSYDDCTYIRGVTLSESTGKVLIGDYRKDFTAQSYVRVDLKDKYDLGCGRNPIDVINRKVILEIVIRMLPQEGRKKLRCKPQRW